jgi:hypothetical protein
VQAFLHINRYAEAASGFNQKVVGDESSRFARAVRMPAPFS